MEKIYMIEGSLRCLRRGWCSVIPVVGIAFAFWALLTFRGTFFYTRDHWNPAKAHLYGGAALALLSLLAHGIAAGLLLYTATR